MPAYRTHARTTTLEVTTDAPLPPTLSIISPTPRAFTFASASSSTPFASPSASPFEPNLKPLRLITPPFIERNLTPDSAISTSSPVFSSPTSSLLPSPISPQRVCSPSHERAAPSFKRRKSTGAVHEPLDRRPKKGDEDYIKRPENAFILFRRKCVEERLTAQEEAIAEAAAAAASSEGAAAKPKKQRQADLSKMISQQWRALPAEDRAYWEQLAKEKKKEHEQLHPDYVYRPQRTKGKNAKPSATNKKGKGRAEEAEHEDSVSFVLPVPAPGSPNRHGRSNSAPNAVTAQTIRLPVVQMPSVPSSPLMLPQIPTSAVARRPSYDWTRMPYQPPSAQSMQGLFQPGYAPQPELPMEYQQAPQFFQGMFELTSASPIDGSSLLPPLMVPSQYYPGQLVSPADSVSPLTPFMSQGASAADWTRMSISSDASMGDAMDLQALPDLYEQPWAYEFVGEFVPGGADFLTDDSFDLAKIPAVALEELCPQEPGASADQAMYGQDPFAGLFNHDFMGAGRF